MTAPTTTDAAVERLLAVQEIQQLAYRYAVSYDSRDLKAFHALWHEDVERRDYPDINIHTVREEFDQYLYEMGPTMLSVSNHVIDLVDADHATGTVYTWAQIDMGEEFIDQGVVYFDHYIRHEGRWLFENRRHELYYGQVRAGNPFRLPPANWPEGIVGRGTLPESFPTFQETRANRPAADGSAA